MQILVSSFSEEPLSRHEMHPPSTFPKAAIRRLVQSMWHLCGSEIASVVIALSGISKVLNREIVGEALDVCEKRGEMPPLQPKHMREVRDKGASTQLEAQKHHLLLDQSLKGPYAEGSAASRRGVA